MKLVTQMISAEETFSLRKQMRPLRSESEQRNPEDDHPDTFHIGTLLGGELVGIASFSREAHREFSATNPYRLRGMATDEKVRGQGIGAETLGAGFRELEKRKCDLLWCNAREAAFNFYERMGLTFRGPMFDIPTIGPHKVMYKYF